MAEDIDLIVPEVNEPTFTRGIIANPNCSTIQSVVPLKVLQDAYGFKTSGIYNISSCIRFRDER